MSKKGETSNKTFQYFMVGAMGLLSAAGAKATVQGRVAQLHTGGVLWAVLRMSGRGRDTMADNDSGIQIS